MGDFVPWRSAVVRFRPLDREPWRRRSGSVRGKGPDQDTLLSLQGCCGNDSAKSYRVSSATIKSRPAEPQGPSLDAGTSFVVGSSLQISRAASALQAALLRLSFLTTRSWYLQEF